MVGTCPDCGKQLRQAKIGSHPKRIFCGRIDCEYDGMKAEDKTHIA